MAADSGKTETINPISEFTSLIFGALWGGAQEVFRMTGDILVNSVTAGAAGDIFGAEKGE